jgi:hypothetical protein
MRQARPQPVATLLKLPLESSVRHVAELRWGLPVVLSTFFCAAAWLDGRRRVVWLALVALMAAASWTRVFLRRRRPVAVEGWLVIDDEQIARVRSVAREGSRGKTSLARWDEPFGLSVLANMARSRALLAFTTPSATRFLGLTLETPRDADLARDLLERAVTIPDADLELATGPNPEVLLGADAARSLLHELERRSPQSLRRLYLSDARGTAIKVEQDTLAIGDDTFDLAAPVEWRVFTFHEGEPGVATLYQATSLRQGTCEAVFVCRAPEDVGSWSVGRAPDAAPAREARVAIDRLFMTPLRAVLEQAPRLSRPGAPPSRDRGRSVLT